jgi:hypothetical protein
MKEAGATGTGLFDATYATQLYATLTELLQPRDRRRGW